MKRGTYTFLVRDNLALEEMSGHRDGKSLVV